MAFTKKSANLTPIVDTVFAVAAQAKKDKLENPDLVVDATIGTLCDEDGKLVAFDSVYNHYDELDHRIKASYAVSFTGNPSFRDVVYEWVKGNSNLALHHSTIASPGGTGAIALAFKACLDNGETMIIPNIAWGSYSLMAQNNNYNVVTYNMFDEDHFDFNSLKEAVLKVKETQERIVIVINDPCHNPTGYSLTIDEWKQVIDFLNDISKTNPCIVLNDIAYIDYSYNLEHNHDYLNVFNEANENILFVIAFSISKTMTSYGMRCGAAIVLAKNSIDVRNMEILMEKTARATWSNINNSAMENFVWVIEENNEEYLDEKKKYIDLLKERSNILIEEAKDCNLELYPYKEGFFVTVKMPNNEVRDMLHEALIKKHIYTVKVNLGIRIAICSLSKAKTKNLAKAIKETLEEVS